MLMVEVFYSSMEITMIGIVLGKRSGTLIKMMKLGMRITLPNVQLVGWKKSVVEKSNAITKKKTKRIQR